jgi:hypothetical protein
MTNKQLQLNLGKTDSQILDEVIQFIRQSDNIDDLQTVINDLYIRDYRDRPFYYTGELIK